MNSFFFFFWKFCYYCVCMCLWVGVLLVSACEDQCVCWGGGVVTHATASLWMSEKNFLESALLPPFYEFWESSSGLQAWVTSTIPCCAVLLDAGHKRLVVSRALVLLLLFILNAVYCRGSLTSLIEVFLFGPALSCVERGVCGSHKYWGEVQVCGSK